MPSTCPQCGKGFTFASVLMSSNPTRIKCGHCDNAARVGLKVVLPIFILVIPLGFGVWEICQHVGLNFKHTFFALIAYGLVIEFAFFIAISRKWIPHVWLSDEKEQRPAKGQVKVVPRIKHTNFISVLSTMENMTGENLPYHEKIAGDLLLTYAIDAGDQYIAITPKIAKDYGLDLDGIRLKADQFALAVLKQLRVIEDEPVHRLMADDTMAACTILYPALWKQLSEAIGASPIVGFVHRDCVLYCSDKDADAVNDLRKQVSMFDGGDNHNLSRLLYRFDGEQFEVYEGS